MSHLCLFRPDRIHKCVVVLSVCPPGLAVGLGIGALAEVAKKTIRHNGAAGKYTHSYTHKIGPKTGSQCLETLQCG